MQDMTPGRKRWTFWRIVFGLLAAGLMLFFVIQLVPVGHDHSSPPITAEPVWPDAETERIARAACFDCHSNETYWPWYSSVAPVSWLISRDVEQGRSSLNFSEWNRGQPELGEVIEAIQEEEMPPYYYASLHDQARLTGQNREDLMFGMKQLWATDPPVAATPEPAEESGESEESGE